MITISPKPDRLSFTAQDGASATGEGPFDHLAMVSVLNDPETFPWVSQVTYGKASPLDLDVAAFDAERRRVRALTDALLTALSLPALVTTTVEEAPWILEAADRLGIPVEADDAVVETALVGDPCGFLYLGVRP